MRNNFIDLYLQYTSRTEVPKIYNKWAAIYSIASALNRSCFVKFSNNYSIYPNLYIVFLSLPGSRKQTGIKICNNLLNSVSIKTNTDYLSVSSLLYDLNKEPKLSFMPHDLAILQNDENIFEFLGDLFHCPKQYKTKQACIKDSYINLLSSITPNFLSLLSYKYFQNRTLFISNTEEINRKVLVFLNEQEKVIFEDLKNILKDLSNLSGEFTLSKDFLSLYSKNYSDMALFEPMFLIKLSMILSVNRDTNMILQEEDLINATKLFKEIKKLS